MCKRSSFSSVDPDVELYQLQSRQCQWLNFLAFSFALEEKKMPKRKGKKVPVDLFQSHTKRKESYHISHGRLGCRPTPGTEARPPLLPWQEDQHQNNMFTVSVNIRPPLSSVLEQETEPGSAPGDVFRS